MNIMLTILLTLSAIFAPVQAPAPTSAPVRETANYSTTLSLAPFKLPSLWAREALADGGVDYPENVVFLFQNEDNCGAELSTVGQGGCTVPMDNGQYAVLISPELAYTAWGNHILFHELAHTMGANECEAEAYAHQFEYDELWSYPECTA